MAVGSSNTVNHAPIHSTSSLSTNTINRVLTKNQKCHSGLNSKSFPAATNKSFTVLHQNIRGVRNKNNHLLRSMTPKHAHVICLTEHHSKENEINNLTINHYILGAKFCRQSLIYGDTCIFVHEPLAFTNIDLQHFCMEQDI
jgi:hypothetical protein